MDVVWPSGDRRSMLAERCRPSISLAYPLLVPSRYFIGPHGRANPTFIGTSLSTCPRKHGTSRNGERQHFPLWRVEYVGKFQNASTQTPTLWPCGLFLRMDREQGSNDHSEFDGGGQPRSMAVRHSDAIWDRVAAQS